MPIVFKKACFTPHKPIISVDDRMAANGSSNGNGSHARKTGLEVTRETREALKSTSFDVWKYEDSDKVRSFGPDLN